MVRTLRWAGGDRGFEVWDTMMRVRGKSGRIEVLGLGGVHAGAPGEQVGGCGGTGQGVRGLQRVKEEP